MQPRWWANPLDPSFAKIPFISQCSLKRVFSQPQWEVDFVLRPTCLVCPASCPLSPLASAMSLLLHTWCHLWAQSSCIPASLPILFTSLLFKFSNLFLYVSRHIWDSHITFFPAFYCGDIYITSQQEAKLEKELSQQSVDVALPNGVKPSEIHNKVLEKFMSVETLLSCTERDRESTKWKLDPQISTSRK